MSFKAPGGNLHLNDKEKTYLLNNFFGSEFLNDYNILPDFSMHSEDLCHENIDFILDKVRLALAKIKNCGVVDHADITKMFFKNLRDLLCLPHSMSYASGKIQISGEQLKCVSFLTKVCHLFYDNHRQISLTCIRCIVMESVINDVTLDHLGKDYLIIHQHGVLKNHTTASQLLECMQDKCNIIESNTACYIVYTDFRKAFDSVEHTKLLHKLKECGFPDRQLKWIESFLNHRT